MFLSAVLALQVDREGRFGVVVRNLKTAKVAYWVDVSESSGADSSWLSWVKDHLNGCWRSMFVIINNNNNNNGFVYRL